MNEYQRMVGEMAQMMEKGRGWPLGEFGRCARPEVAPDAPRVLVFSPHPDDEVIIGGVALRLMRESGWRVVNVAVTLGSRKDRQAGRLEELRRCCDCVGFGLVETGPGGLEGVNAGVREREPGRWGAMVEVVRGILEAQRPAAVLFPHAEDWNSTHVGTHWLLMDALRRMPMGFGCHVLETEFWGQMTTPNLMVELGVAEVGDMVTALTHHVGEVQRNPYHLLMPAWMMDNVRRGAELVAGQGKGAPRFTYATLYRLGRWEGGELKLTMKGGRQLSLGEKAGTLFGG